MGGDSDGAISMLLLAPSEGVFRGQEGVLEKPLGVGPETL